MKLNPRLSQKPLRTKINVKRIQSELEVDSLHIQYAHSLLCSLYISLDADKKNLFNSQEHLSLVIISFVLVTLMCDLGVVVWGEIR